MLSLRFGQTPNTIFEQQMMFLFIYAAISRFSNSSAPDNFDRRATRSQVMKQLEMQAAVLCAAVMIALGYNAGLHAQDNGEHLGKSGQPLTIKDVRNWTENGNVVPVCWDTPGYDREKAIVIAALGRTWEQAANIKFTDWYACPTGNGIGGSGSDKYVRVRILPYYVTDPDEVSNAGATGSARGYGMDALSSADENSKLAADLRPGVTFVFNPDGTADVERVEYVGVHEFGHVLGFVHEQDTPGNVEGPAHCKSSGLESNSSSLTSYDRDSIMNYCNKDGNSKGNLTATDIAGVQAVYGRHHVALGRVQSTTPTTPPRQLGNEPLICARARDARARNSPVAPELTAQCEALGGDFTERKVTQLPNSAPDQQMMGAKMIVTPDPPICIRARDARARNSPAAPMLEDQCRAEGGQ